MFPAGHRVFAEGGYADKFWLVESGTTLFPPPARARPARPGY